MEYYRLMFVLIVMAVGLHHAQADGFLTSPLQCGDPACSFEYGQGAYTPLILNSVLDHSLKKGSNGYWPYEVKGDGADRTVVGFNGEVASGSSLSRDPSCIYGRIWLKASPNVSSASALTNGSGCGESYASYDEHPGYDYRAADGTPVKAAAPGKVVAGTCVLNGIADCASWGYVGIDHGNGYITQYGHLSKVYVTAGATVYEGQVIGLSGHQAPQSLPAHLHFEVLKKIGTTTTRDTTLVVDPYGWRKGGGDPLVSGTGADPRYQSNRVSNSVLWADRCDKISKADDPVASGYGAAYDVFSTLHAVTLRAACQDTSVRLMVGSGLPNERIYRYGYEWRNGRWNQFSFSGSTLEGNYFAGSAVATLSRSLAELSKDGYVIAFTCSKAGNEWKCGCRDSACIGNFWQIQKFRQSGPKLWN